MKSISKLFLAVAFLLGLVESSKKGSGGGLDRPIQIINESGRRIELYWVHSATDELVKQSDPFVYNGATFNLNSFVGHKFQVREMPGAKSGVCGDESENLGARCRISYFTVNSNYDQTVTVKPGLYVEHEDEKSVARADALKTITECKAKAQQAIEESGHETISQEFLTKTYDELLLCVEGSVSKKLEKATEEISFQTNLRNKMGELIEKYTCGDDNLKPTKPESTHTWQDKRTGASIKIDVHYEEKNIELTEESPIVHVLKNFVRPEECLDLKARSQPDISPYIPIAWTNKKDSVTLLGLRMLDYALKVIKVSIREGEQDALLLTTWVGNGAAGDDAPSQIPQNLQAPASKIEQKGRIIGQFILNCDTPNIGGAYIFRNSGIHLIPEAGDAIFINNGGDLDSSGGSVTEFSICPVTDGLKTVYTQTLRINSGPVTE